jgi:hypothetical protein
LGISGYASYDYNALTNASEEFHVGAGGDHDVVVSGGFNWQSSSFGNYYLPGGSPLIAKGDVTANLVGLYYFTTQTSQAPEGDSQVDIGYHYVAADGYGNPLADGTGQPYYLDAGNGNIVEESGELSGAVAPIQFTIAVPNQYVNNATVPLQLTIQSGVPYYCTVMLDSTNFAGASWTPYTSSTIAANLGTAQGWHTVWVGLCGQPSGPAGGALQTWNAIRLNLDLTAPVLVITSPLAGTVSVPVVQLQGYSQVALQSISYDLANDAGVVTNQQVLMLDQVYDTGACQFTTNYFQAFDVSLAPGLNAFTFHATDLAGNTTAASYNLTLDYSGKPAPTVQVYWPLNGTAVSGSSFACNGWVSDPTATVTVQIEDTDGNTNVVNAAVGRDGDFWAENVPLSPGLNCLTITTTDVANNIVTTSLTVAQGSLALNIDSVSPGQTTVNGEINSGNCANYTIWVNGVMATCTGSASWTAQIVPIGASGGVVEAMAIPNTDNGGQGSGGLDPSGNPYDAQAEGVQGPVAAAQGSYISMYNSTNYSHINTYGLDEHDSLAWTNGQGGSEQTFYYGDWLPYYPIISTSAWPPSTWPQPWPNGLQTNTLLYGSGFTYVIAIGPPPLIMEHCNIAQTNTFAVDQRRADCKVNLATGGNKGSSQANLWVISLAAGCPCPPWATLFDNTEQGQGPNTPVPPQNISIGKLGNLGPDGNLYVPLPDNTTVDITPTVSGLDYVTFGPSNGNPLTARKYSSYITVYVRQPYPDFLWDGYPTTLPPLGYPVYKPDQGVEAGHVWWRLGSDAPIQVLNQFTTPDRSQWLNRQVGYSPVDTTTDWWACLVNATAVTSGPGYFDTDNGSPSVSATYIIGFQGKGLLKGLQHSETLNNNPGTWNSLFHSCVKETVLTGHAAGVQLPNGPTDYIPQYCGRDLPHGSQ